MSEGQPVGGRNGGAWGMLGGAATDAERCTATSGAGASSAMATAGNTLPHTTAQ